MFSTSARAICAATELRPISLASWLFFSTSFSKAANCPVETSTWLSKRSDLLLQLDALGAADLVAGLLFQGLKLCLRRFQICRVAGDRRGCLRSGRGVVVHLCSPLDSNSAWRLCRSRYTGLVLRSMTTSDLGDLGVGQIRQGPLRLLELAEKSPVLRTHCLEFGVGIRRTCSRPTGSRPPWSGRRRRRYSRVPASTAPACVRTSFSFSAEICWSSLRRSRRFCRSLLTTSFM